MENSNNKISAMESRYRSVLKGISWRIIATASTILVSWIITKRVDLALSIGVIEFVAKLALYYFHERAWNKVRLGKQKQIEYEI